MTLYANQLTMNGFHTSSLEIFFWQMTDGGIGVTRVRGHIAESRLILVTRMTLEFFFLYGLNTIQNSHIFHNFFYMV